VLAQERAPWLVDLIFKAFPMQLPPEGEPDARPPTRSVRLAAVVVVLLLAAVMLEAMAQGAYALRNHIKALPVMVNLFQQALDLDPYEMPSQRILGHWTLRPGSGASVEDLLEYKRKAGRIIGERALKALLDQDGGKGSSLRINMDGFKGPEIDPSHKRFRILALGDSCTFGSAGLDYPRVMERALRRRGHGVEVINGGVEGYAPQNILNEMERYGKLRPNLVTLYIGWNALFSPEPSPMGPGTWSRIPWLLDRSRRLIQALTQDPRDHAVQLYNRALVPNPKARELAALDHYEPPFMDGITRIIDHFAETGTPVALVTLPGLFTLDTEPTPRALELGHLPPFTDNPFVLAKLTHGYNQKLRDLAKDRGLHLVDLESWSRDELRPRHTYFTDSVHLTPEGLKRIGNHMAGALEAVFSFQHRSGLNAPDR
jgi:lysophospholipase L1-like esterase